MPNGIRPLNWVERYLKNNVHRDVASSDGQSVSISAHPRGIPPQRRRWVSPTPYYFGVVRDVVAFLRYRVKYRGAWVVEVREHSFERVVADGVFPSRAAGMAGLEQVRRVVPTLRLADIDHSTLRAPARVT